MVKDRKSWLLASVAAAGACAGGLLISVPPASASLTETVIVTATGPLSALNAVLDVGGSVLNSFQVINGVEATIPPMEQPLLAALPGIVVTPDLSVSLQGDTDPGDPPHTPAAVFPQETGASDLAAQGDTGQGVTVAVLDTGIDNLPDFSGRLLGGVDLTGGGNPFSDGYGHGTFVAGLVAGDGASSGGQYTGEATGADLVSIKVAGPSGTTDLASVIAGVQWAVDNAPRYNIRVLNMSLGFEPITSTLLNPLDIAVEQAWTSGITVVASAGNAGPFNGTILSPGDDPLVITAGALDDLGTPSPSDDIMTDFSSAGPTNPDGWVKPDLVASGRSVVSLAAPGSTVYNDDPTALVGAANFVGSGTSFSAAIISGAAALILAENPGATPNDVKARLLGTTTPGPIGDPNVDGHGALDAYAAATAAPMTLQQSALSLVPAVVGATVSLDNNSPVSTWNPSLWVGVTWTSDAWNGGAWNGDGWAGGAWNGFAWDGRAWNGGAWNGGAWNGRAWNGGAWNGRAWNGGAWNGATWSGGAWNGSSWS